MPQANRMRGKAMYESATYQILNRMNELPISISRKGLRVIIAANPIKLGGQGKLYPVNASCVFYIGSRAQELEPDRVVERHCKPDHEEGRYQYGGQVSQHNRFIRTLDFSCNEGDAITVGKQPGASHHNPESIKPVPCSGKLCSGGFHGRFCCGQEGVEIEGVVLCRHAIPCIDKGRMRGDGKDDQDGQPANHGEAHDHLLCHREDLDAENQEKQGNQVYYGWRSGNS